MVGFETALNGGLALDPISTDWLCEAFNQLRPKFSKHKEFPEKAARCVTHDKSAGLRKLLKPCGEVRRLAHHGLLLSRAFPDEITNDDQSCRNPDSAVQLPGGWRLQSGHSCADCQPRTDRPFGLVLVRFGPAEVGQNTISHQLRHMSLKPGDLACYGVLISRKDLTHLLGIEVRCHRCRANQIAKHHSQLSAFSRGPRGNTSRLG